VCVKMRVTFLVVYWERMGLPCSKLKYFLKKLKSSKEIGCKLKGRGLENEMSELLC
jgi:hypothetical protein